MKRRGDEESEKERGLGKVAVGQSSVGVSVGKFQVPSHSYLLL